ncbi:MAG TPA: gamma-glutamyl-gamma-aminobutyrate hydrolase family protein [bacterium]|nr:gamma-glutamyl-gamma-aminobutyrate hydrolase family protein [bacterium]
MKPRIGVTTSVGGSKKPRNQRYVDAVRRAGGEPEWIEPQDIFDAGGPGALLRSFDGLLLSGGLDIDPADYGQTLIEDIGVQVDAQRYRAELPLTREALAMNLPVLGICGGMHALTVAGGGTLHQDLSLIGIDVASHYVKGQPVLHAIAIDPDSRLMDVLGASPVDVASSHHQVAKKLGGGFEVVATAPDGVIEAIEAPAYRFAIGVQWHPDLMPDDERQQRLFEALIAAARLIGARSPG